MTETIGKIVLDDTHYPGEDLYCDGEVEDTLLAIARDCPPAEYQGIIEERASWPVLYHLSALRENIVDWVPMDKTAKVLEVGSGCGAVTGKLAGKAGSVTCIDLSKKRSRINAYRHQDCENVIIHVGNFKDIEPELACDFDFIFLIGVFEYGQSYMGTKHPYEDLLKLLLRHKKKDGRIILAIENRLGLKYFAGCKEDHLGDWFSGIEDYAAGGGVRTFTRSGLERIFGACGVEEYSFYYPWPDYKFMTALYSDGRLPRAGELTENLRNFDRDRMLLFDEKQAFDGIIKDGLFPVFSNSLLAVIGGGFDVKYAKYSNDRAPEYRIRTEIVQSGEEKIIKKQALSEEAAAHIRNMRSSYEQLTERYDGGKLAVNRCLLSEDGRTADFEYVEGVTLEELLDGCLERGDMHGFRLMFQEYLERISFREEMPVADYDLIFSNILVSGDTWTVIDYEWTFGRPMSARETAFRAIYCYVLENEKRRNKLNLDLILKELGITEQEAEEYRQREMEFQKFVTGKHLSMAELRERIGGRILEPEKWVYKFDDSSDRERVQVYEDRGNGYREEESYFVKDACDGENRIRLLLPVSGDVSMLRIDPAMDCCAVMIKELLFNEKRVEPSGKNIVTNGRRLQNGSYVFATGDPNINIRLSGLDRKAENVLEASLDVVRMPKELAEAMAGAVKKIF